MLFWWHFCSPTCKEARVPCPTITAVRNRHTMLRAWSSGGLWYVRERHLRHSHCFSCPAVTPQWGLHSFLFRTEMTSSPLPGRSAFLPRLSHLLIGWHIHASFPLLPWRPPAAITDSAVYRTWLPAVGHEHGAGQGEWAFLPAFTCAPLISWFSPRLGQNTPSWRWLLVWLPVWLLGRNERSFEYNPLARIRRGSDFSHYGLVVAALYGVARKF